MDSEFLKKSMKASPADGVICVSDSTVLLKNKKNYLVEI